MTSVCGATPPGPPLSPSALDPRPDPVAPPHHDPRSVADLLLEVSTGAVEPFEALYAEMGPRVYGVAVRVLRDPAQAQEVAQEAFVQVWRDAARFDPSRGSGQGWVMTIAHRAAVDRVRSSQATRRRDVDFHTRHREVDFDTTAEAVQSSFAARRVHDALALLSSEQRAAITLAYFGGLTYVEVAERLGAPVPTTKSRIRAGLARLRAHLEVAERAGGAPA